MKTINISIRILGVLLFVLLPNTSSAYFTTNQTATKVNGNAAIFTIDYAFGLEDQDVYMPVIAKRNLAWGSSEKKVGYSFVENGNQVQETGNAVGIVMSNAPIVDGMYKLEKGKAQKLTLYVILVTQTDEHENDYALKVDSLPFFVDTGKSELEQRQLNPTELNYYVTKEVELNTGNFN